MTTRVLFLLAVGLTTWGCGRSTTPIGAGDPSRFLLTPDDGSKDPYACDMQRVDRSSPLYPSFNDGGAIQSFSLVNDGDTSFMGLCKRDQQICWYASEDESIDNASGRTDFSFNMVCQFTCDADSDCPAPSAGTAVATCVNPNPAIPKSGQCALVCAGGRMCPDGFACAKPPIGTVGPDFQQSESPEQCLQTKELSAAPVAAPVGDGGARD